MTLPLFNARLRKNRDHKFYYASMGKLFRVIAIAHSDDQANEFCSKNDDCGVIGVLGEAVVIAELHGEKIKT